MKCTTFFLLITFFSVNNIHAQSKYKQGYEEYFHGDLKKAIALFRQSIQEKKEIVNSSLYIGAANTFLKNFAEAKNWLDKVYNEDSTTQRLFYYYGKYYALMGDANKALECYDKEIMLYPKNTYTYSDRGTIKEFLGDYPGAFEDFSTAIILNPKDKEAYNNRGYAKLRMKQYTDAIKDFTASLKIEPDQKGYSNRGFAYALMDRYRNAIDDYKMALKINPNDPETLYLRGYSYKKLKIVDSACIDFKLSWKLGYKAAKDDIAELHCD